MLIAATGSTSCLRESTSGRPRTCRMAASRDLGDLKARVIAMVVLVAAVTFVETIVDNGLGPHVLDEGVGIAAVIVALTAFVRLGESGRPDA